MSTSLSFSLSLNRRLTLVYSAFAIEDLVSCNLQFAIMDIGLLIDKRGDMNDEDELLRGNAGVPQPSMPMRVLRNPNLVLTDHSSSSIMDSTAGLYVNATSSSFVSIKNPSSSFMNSNMYGTNPSSRVSQHGSSSLV
ncbi:hypothetical protein Tco_1300099, partial [Tanacetum coccineum]